MNGFNRISFTIARRLTMQYIYKYVRHTPQINIEQKMWLFYYCRYCCCCCRRRLVCLSFKCFIIFIKICWNSHSMQFEMQFNWDICMRVFYKRAISLNIVGECVMHDTTQQNTTCCNQHVCANTSRWNANRYEIAMNRVGTLINTQPHTHTQHASFNWFLFGSDFSITIIAS